MFKKKLIFDLLYIILIVSLILFMVWITFYLRSNSIKCIANPINYLEDKNSHINMSCYCYSPFGEVLIENRKIYKLTLTLFYMGKRIKWKEKKDICVKIAVNNIVLMVGLNFMSIRQGIINLKKLIEVIF